jgi:hypothetical protein
VGSFAGLAEKAVETSPEWWQSMRAMVSKTEAGKLWADTLQNKAEPLIGKVRQSLLDTKVTPKVINPATKVPWTADEAMHEARAQVKQQLFGKNNVMMMPLLKAVEKQGGKVAAEHLADAHNVYWTEDAMQGSAWRSKAATKEGIGISPSSYYSAPRSGEKALKDISRSTNLPLISIPHAAQAPLNSLAVNGTRATMNAFAEFAASPKTAKAFAAKVGAISQEYAYEIMAANKGTSSFRMLLDPLRKVFNVERRYGIAFSAVAGKHAAIQAAEDFFKSQGKNKAAEMQLKLLGQDPNRILSQRGQLTDDDIETAAFRGASEVMGFRSPLETPVGWDSNGLARIATIYKQYGFRTMTLHKDILKRAYQSEGLIGVAKKAALYATIFPIAGELIKSAEGLVTLQNPWSQEKQKGNLLHSEYIDATAMAMGYNLVYGIARSSMYHNLSNFFAGPIISTGTDLLTDVTQMAQNPKHPVKPLAKDVLRRAGLPGRIAAQKLFPPKKTKSATQY